MSKSNNNLKIIGEVNKNSMEKIQVSLQSFKGSRHIDARVYYLEGEDWLPTKKGLKLTENNYQEVLDLIEKAADVLRKEERKLNADEKRV